MNPRKILCRRNTRSAATTFRYGASFAGTRRASVVFRRINSASSATTVRNCFLPTTYPDRRTWTRSGFTVCPLLPNAVGEPRAKAHRFCESGAQCARTGPTGYTAPSRSSKRRRSAGSELSVQKQQACDQQAYSSASSSISSSTDIRVRVPIGGRCAMRRARRISSLRELTAQ